MKRSTVAFVVAPLWVPVVVTPIAALEIFPGPAQWPWVGAAALLSAGIAYLGALVLGAPALRWFASRGWTAWWVAALFGFVVAGMAWILALAASPLLLGEDVRAIVPSILGGLNAGWRVMLAAGALGATVGATFWLIARPDRGPPTSQGSVFERPRRQ